MVNEVEIQQARSKIAEIASSVLAGSAPAILSFRSIVDLAMAARISWEHDPDISNLADVQGYGLPFDPEVQKLWNPAALEKLRPEMETAESMAKAKGEQYCKNLVARFGKN